MSDTQTAARSGQVAHGRVLFVLCGTHSAEHPLPAEGTVVVGRGRDADVIVDHPTLSRAHAKLTLGAHVTVADCGSRNGTFVAGRMLGRGEVVLVAPGSPIEVGEALLVVRAGGDPGRDLLASTGASGAGPGMLERTIMRIAESDVPVLLVGEAGTGKSFLAGRIHASSRRAGSRLVVLHASPTTNAYMVEERIADAANGTLVVREPSLLGPSVQAALLAALLAAGPAIRTVTLTARDLHADAQAARLDAALLHRLAGVSVVVPPLRARVGDLATLADALLAEVAAEHGRPRMLLSPDAIVALGRHTWPGNVRELRNVLASAVLLGKGRVLTASQLDIRFAELAPGAGAGSLASAVDEAEHRRILEALRQHNGNQTRAAKALGISRGTLISRLERFGVPRPRK